MYIQFKLFFLFAISIILSNNNQNAKSFEVEWQTWLHIRECVQRMSVFDIYSFWYQLVGEVFSLSVRRMSYICIIRKKSWQPNSKISNHVRKTLKKIEHNLSTILQYLGCKVILLGRKETWVGILSTYHTIFDVRSCNFPQKKTITSIVRRNWYEICFEIFILAKECPHSSVWIARRT